jgi:hypothetical protein
MLHREREERGEQRREKEGGDEDGVIEVEWRSTGEVTGSEDDGRWRWWIEIESES